MAPLTTTGYLNGKELAARGWTEAMVRDFLGSPDHVVIRPNFPNAAPMLQFALSRIDAAEGTTEFVNRLEVAARRSAAARKAWDRRREELLRLVAADQVPIPRLAPDVLADRAVRHSDAREAVNAGKVNGNTLNRWKVNYLRYELIRFDATIEGLFGQAGRAAAEKLMRRRTLETIARTYPDLHDECQRQLRVSERRR
jgi:hypothetical protein